MKTPEQVSLERVAKASEQMAKVMVDLTKAIERQNAILSAGFSKIDSPPQYRDVEEDRSEKAPKVIIK